MNLKTKFIDHGTTTKIEIRQKTNKHDGKSTLLRKDKNKRVRSIKNIDEFQDLNNIAQGDAKSSRNSNNDIQEQSSKFIGENQSPSLKQPAQEYIPAQSIVDQQIPTTTDTGKDRVPPQ